MFVAERLGYGPMFLCGVDMGYHSGKERFTGYTVTTPERRSMIANAGEVVIPAQWERHEHPTGDTSKLSLGADTIVTNNGLITHPVHLYYKKNLMAAWRLSLINVWSTDSGIITEMPHADIHKVVAYQGSPRKFRPLKPAKCKEISEVYLASVGAFVVECEHGLNFVESTDVENEIPAFIRKLNRGYVCGKCGTMFESNDDLPHDGAECPTCKANELKHRNYADVDKNMARIRARLKAAGFYGG
jgi:DNA-directed RNA polymerase subunit RPC12/RpoP